MGMFNKNYEKEAEELWEDVEKNLRPKDGLQHVLMMDGALNNLKSSLKTSSCLDIWNIKVNIIIEKMQKYGYKIIDIKISSISYSIVTEIIYE